MDAYLNRDDDAFETVSAMSSGDPEQVWRFLEIAREADLTVEQLAFISAGPFEDVMGHHGANLIERVEIAARQDRSMRQLVALVWQGGMQPAIWARIEALRVKLDISPL